MQVVLELKVLINTKCRGINYFNLDNVYSF